MTRRLFAALLAFAVTVLLVYEVLDRRDAAAGRRMAILTPALIAALVLSLVVSFVLARALARPLDRLVDAARRVGDSGSAPPLVEPKGPPEVRELTDAFNSMSLRVRELLDRQSRFASDVSHQLRTPLMAIGLAFERMQDLYLTGNLADTEATFLIARGEVARLARLVEGLLALTRVPLDQAGSDTVDVADVARERVAAWTDLATEHGLMLTVDAPPHVGAAALTGAVDQILDNLVDNAIDAAPEGSTIAVSVVESADDVVVSVRDHGSGLSDLERERAFERFWRRADARDGGIGIGLTIVRDLAEACRGDVALLPASGGGTRAVLTLRAASLEPPAELPRSEPEPSPATVGKRSGARATKVAAIVFGLVVVGGGVAAAEGSLPSPVQQAVSHALAPFGIRVPDTTASARVQSRRSKGTSAVDVHPARPRGALVAERGQPAAALPTDERSPASTTGDQPLGADPAATPPGNRSSAPGQAKKPTAPPIAPGKSASAPGQAKKGAATVGTPPTAPGKSASAPGQARKATAAAGDPEAAPGRSAAAPGQAKQPTAAAGDSETGPGRSGAAPGHSEG